MTDADDKARQIFHAALSLDGVARSEYLEVACRDDVELRDQVEGLLSAINNAGQFMETNAPIAQQIDAEIDKSSSKTIGRYKLLQQIGEGGFGIVYMAEQQEPVRRRVALKVIKPGMDTKQVIGRFEAERQALAMLDHPNIAKVYDAGATDQGRPYFVMELVRGESITEFCDANRFDTTQRLELFVEVCNAIQHAHQKGIIHRDIKPSNVLVTIIDDHPVPKVIDFGIAKATAQRLTERTVFTEFKQFLGTPTYMSPEQASLSGTDIDTRSDVYSLGVLLYELLVGTPPFDDKELRALGFEEICQVIRETVPPTPSNRISTLGERSSLVTKNRGADVQTLQSKLRGEVDWIVMKSLEKDRARRYETSSALADDIARFLNQEPVLAGPPSTLYQLRKLAQRNRWAAVTTIAIAASLLLGTAAATIGLLRANAQAKRAVVAEEKAEDRAAALAQSEARFRRNLYVTEMATAKREFDQYSISRTKEILDRYLPEPGRPDLRGFEWRWLWNQCHREAFHLTGGPNYDPESGFLTRDMRFSADGKWLATGATDGYVRLWDMTARREVWRFKIAEHCNTVDFSPDSRLLLANGWLKDPPGGVFIWDISDPQSPVLLPRLDGHGARFSADGKTIIGGRGNELDFAGNQTREPFIIGNSPNGQLWARHYSKDWKTLATQNRIWDVPSGELLATLPLHDGFMDVGPTGVAISPIDSNLIATGSPQGVRLWDRNGNQIGEIPDTGGTPLAWLSFSADGRRLAVRQFSGAVRIFETENWTEIDAIPIPYPDNSVVFSPVDNDLFVAGGTDGVIRAYNVSTENIPDVSFEHSSEILCLKFSSDGKFVAAGANDGSVLFWDIAARRQVFLSPVTGGTRPGSLRAFTSYSPDYVAFSRDSRHAVIAGSETISVYDVATWQVVHEWTNPYDPELDVNKEGEERRRRYGAVGFSKDGNRLFARYAHTRVDVWDWQNRKAEFRPDLSVDVPYFVRAIDLSPKELFVAIYENSLNVLTLPNLEPLSAGEQAKLDVNNGSFGGINLEFSPDGDRLAVSEVSVKVIDVANWELIAKLPHASIIEHVAWSPDGTRIAAADTYATTKLWDVETRKTAATFRGSISAFSPDGTILAVGAQGSKYIGDSKHLGRVTLHYAPPLSQIDAQINDADQ